MNDHIIVIYVIYIYKWTYICVHISMHTQTIISQYICQPRQNEILLWGNIKYHNWNWKSLSSAQLFTTSMDSPGENTGVGSLSLLQGIFPTQGSNPGLLHCRQKFYQLSHKGIGKVDINNMTNWNANYRALTASPLPPHIQSSWLFYQIIKELSML